MRERAVSPGSLGTAGIDKEAENIGFGNFLVFEVFLDPGRAVFKKGDEQSLGKAIGHNPSLSVLETIVNFLSRVASFAARTSGKKGFVFLAITRDGRMKPGIIFWFYRNIRPPLGFWIAESAKRALIEVYLTNAALATAIGSSFRRTAINMVSAAMGTHIAHRTASRTKRYALLIHGDCLVVIRGSRICYPDLAWKGVAGRWLVCVRNSIADIRA